MDHLAPEGAIFMSKPGGDSGGALSSTDRLNIGSLPGVGTRSKLKMSTGNTATMESGSGLTPTTTSRSLRQMDSPP